MGNNHSASNRPPPPASASASASGHDTARQHRKEAPRGSIVPIAQAHAQAHAHTAQRSVAPETDKTDSKALALPPTAASSLSASPHSSSSSGGNDSTSNTRSNTAELPKSLPVDVPVVERPLPLPLPSSVAEPLLMASNSFSDMYISRPPRLPLPIEEEVHTPGSPILGSAANADETLVGAGAAAAGELGDAGESSDLTRKSSALSTNTADDEDSEELRVDKTRPVVPTRLEWRGGGEKVYVTGTIFQWNRKHRLHPVEGQPGVFAATIYILPGTHHVRFLVDGIMQTSPNLPTTVDFGNNLVNYIEVTADEARRDKSAVLPRIGDDGVAAATAAAAAGGPAAGGTGGVSSRTSSHVGEQRSALRGKAVPPAESYRHQLPQYLVDFDQAEESPAYRSAVAAIEKLPTPPSLPGFLGKPILNAATLMKDDNSVLNMPNHTILNHLATSSIKNNVLAVSATTRYHNKYVTTIIYKPTSSDEG